MSTTTARSYRTCNVHLEPMDLGQAVAELVDSGPHVGGRAVHLCNAYTLSLTAKDEDYAAVIDRGDLNLTDGMPLAWLGRRLGFDVDPKDRPRGCDVFIETARAGVATGLRHYLYGGTPEVVGRLADELRQLAPGIQIAGVESPPFRPLEPSEKDELVHRVKASGADIVWVGLGTPKQDHFVDEYREKLGATLVAVGAAFDFIAGSVPQAPEWMRRNGVEWVHRLASEPRRLWKRYLVGNTTFVAGAVRTGARVSS